MNGQLHGERSIRIIRLPEVVAKTGFSRTTIYERLKHDAAFPRPIALGERAIGFVEHEVDAYLIALIEASRKGATS